MKNPILDIIYIENLKDLKKLQNNVTTCGVIFHQIPDKMFYTYFNQHHKSFFSYYVDYILGKKKIFFISNKKTNQKVFFSIESFWSTLEKNEYVFFE